MRTDKESRLEAVVFTLFTQQNSFQICTDAIFIFFFSYQSACQYTEPHQVIKILLCTTFSGF